MKFMKMPGFTAEASLCNNHDDYNGSAIFNGTDSNQIIPQLPNNVCEALRRCCNGPHGERCCAMYQKKCGGDAGV